LGGGEALLDVLSCERGLFILAWGVVARVADFHLFEDIQFIAGREEMRCTARATVVLVQSVLYNISICASFKVFLVRLVRKGDAPSLFGLQCG